MAFVLIPVTIEFVLILAGGVISLTSGIVAAYYVRKHTKREAQLLEQLRSLEKDDSNFNKKLREIID